MSVKPDLKVTAAAAQAIIARVLPDCSVAGISNIHGGEIAAVYEISFVEARPPLVLKVYPEALHWKMQKETTVLGTLVQDRLSVPVPQILLADDTKALLALNFILMSKLDGTDLGRLERELSPKQRASAYAQIGQLLREFHRIPMDAFGYIGANGIVTPHATNGAYLSVQFDKKLKEFANRGGAAALAQRVAAYVTARVRLLDACTHPVLCHNDLHAGNLLATMTGHTVRLSGVLDFEGALAGDPLMDVAKSLYYLNDESKRAVLEGYGEPDRQNWKQTLALYHLYFVLELWCWMAQIGNIQPLEGLARDLERCSAS